MNVSPAAQTLIKNFEGCRLEAYDDGTGVETIGYGHTPATPGDVWTQGQADRIFQTDIEHFADGVGALLKVVVNPPQFGAMVSLAYNIGLGAFEISSVLRLTNEKDWDNAADAFLRWNQAGGQVLPGLQRRREAERAMYLQDLPKD